MMQPFNYGYPQQMQQPRYQEPYMGYTPKPAPSAITGQENVRWIPVAGIEGARNHIVQPNVTAWLMDNNEPYFYVKSADAYGVVTLKTFRFEEVANVEAVKSDYVSRGEFNEWAAKVEQLLKGVNINGESVNE